MSGGKQQKSRHARKTKAQLISELKALERRVQPPKAATEAASTGHGAPGDGNSLFRTVFDHMSASVFLVDPGMDEIVDVNASACTLLGYEYAALLAKRISDIHPEEMTELQAFADEVIAAGQSWTDRFFCLSRGGRFIPVEMSASRVEVDNRMLMCVVARDVTERRKAERDLKASEKRFKDFAAAASDWFWEMDENLCFSYFSDRFTEVTGVTPEKLLGKTRQETYIPGVDPEAWQRHLADLAAHRPFRAFVHPRTLANGEVVYLSINGIPVFDEDSEFRGYRGIGTDVSKIKAAEQAMRIAKEQAELANRSKSDFLANMSHELRTPLNAVIGFAEVIAGEMFGPTGNPLYRDYANDIRESGLHLLSLINDILDLSKIEAGKLMLHDTEVDVVQAVSDCLRIVKPRALDNNVKLLTRFGRDLPDLRADERALKQVVINLLSNAVKFTPPGGVVTVTTEIDDVGSFLIKVTDTGIGIAPDHIATVLEPFGQVDALLTRKHQGTGLGLPLVKSLMELHDGRLELASELHVGTQVTARFPAARVVDRALQAAAAAG